MNVKKATFASYADTSPYSCVRDTQAVISELKSISTRRFH